ncbi:MAG: tetratricopeptide repeat protein [Planctomycetes bacterium]|nr:tetratricopeptide repeat protein [Planctomycetota bacterium]
MRGETGAERTFTIDELAELCGLPVAVVNRWVDRDLLRPMRGTVRRFAFRSVGTARTLAQLWRDGWSAPRIARAWQLARSVVADRDAALAGLLASIGQKKVAVRTPDGRLVEPTGQLLFDFGAEVDGGKLAAPLPQLRSSQDWFAIGVDAEAAGRLDDAVRAYERALPGGTAEAHFNLGNCYYALKRRKEAVDQFAGAIARAPDYAEAWNNLGIVRGEVGDRHGAVAALERALELVPHYADAHYNLAEALAVVGDLERARKHWRAYLTFDPNSRWAEQARRRLQNSGGS